MTADPTADATADATGPGPAGGDVVRLVLASHNRHKVTELRRILAEAGLSLQVLDAGDVPDLPEVAETGVTFAENALLKARAAALATGLPAVADDSGLCVDVLGGAPGVFSARWSGRHGDDLANLQLLLAQLGDVPDAHRGARFACSVALVVPGAAPGDVVERVVEGTMPGRLIREARGANGFGYDPIFVPDGEERTSAELSDVEKDAISHRGNALRALVPVLSEVLPVAAAPGRAATDRR